MDSELLNESQEESKKEEKEMEQEDKAEKGAAESENPMPDQSPTGGESEGGESKGEEPAGGETEGGETKGGEAEGDESKGGETKGEEPEGEKEENGKDEDEEDDTFVGKASKKAEPLLNKAKGFGEFLLQKYVKYTQKEKSHKVGDFLSNMADNVHYARKGIWKKIKSGVSALKGKAKNSPFGKWVTKKKEEREAKKAAEAGKPKKPGFFGKIWGAVKTGAGFLKDKITNTGFGKWVTKKKEERAAKKAAEAEKPDEPGFFSRTFSKIKTGVGKAVDWAMNTKVGKRMKKEYDKGKEWFNEQKKWVDEKLEAFKEAKDLKDEADAAHNHERRIANLSKKDPDYGKRYKELVEELKKNEGVKDLQNSISRDDIAKIMKELEAGKEDGEKKSTGQKVANGFDKASTAVGKSYKVFSGISEAQAEFGSDSLGMISEAITVLDDTVKLKESQKEVDRTEGLKNDEDVKKDDIANRYNQLQNQKAKNTRNNSAINLTKDTVTLAGDAIEKTGVGKIANIAKNVTNFSLEVGRAAMNAKNDKETRKMSIKGIMGGVEGYKALKEKYKMKAPEMRYAMLEVLGLQSEQDIVNADVGNLATKVYNSDSKGSRKVRGDAENLAKIYENGGGNERGVKRSRLKLSKKTEETSPAKEDTKEDKNENPEPQPA
jgi:hypothetical protein